MRATKFRVLWLALAAARVLAVAAPIPAVLLAGCEKGPFEEAGEEIDDAVDDAEDEIDRRN
jgi:hypothetical protein